MGNELVEYSLKEIRSIKYSPTSMVVNTTHGSGEWDISTISNMTFNNVDNVTSVSDNVDNVVISHNNSFLSLSFDYPVTVRVYNISGRLIDSINCCGCTTLDLTKYGKGLFFISVAGKTFKVL